MHSHRIAVLGTGGVGGYFGALLARAGHQVTFIARGQQLAALRTTGLHLRGTLGDFDLAPVDVRAPGEPLSGCELVLFAVKNYDLPGALPALDAIVGPQTTVVSLLNGVEAPEQIAQQVAPERLLVGQCGVGVWVSHPGTIRQEGARRQIQLAAWTAAPQATERLHAVAALLRAAEVSVSVSADVQAAMWHKLIWTASYGAIAALTGTAAGQLRRAPELVACLQAAMLEGLAVARGLAVDAPAHLVEHFLGVLAGLSPTARPSLLRDRDAGRQLEIDALSGAIVRAGRLAGIPTPLHGLFWAALRAPVGLPTLETGIPAG